MSAPLDEDNLERSLARHKFQEGKARRESEEDRAWRERREKFERDKALKDKKPLPWTAEQWQRARERLIARAAEPQPRIPVIITNSTGPFTTPEKLQEVAGLSSLPDVRWTTRTSIYDTEEGKQPEKVQYCDVNWEQLVKVQEYSNGEDVLVWFEGKRRCAWLAHSVKKDSGDKTGD